MKLNKLTSALLLSSVALSQSLYASESAEQTAEDPNAHKFSGSVALGFLYSTGDVKSYDLSHRTDVKHEFDRFKNTYLFDIKYKRSEQDVTVDDVVVGTEMNTTEQKWFTELQTNYTFDDIKKNYMFGSLKYEDNRFSAYDYQSALAAGWGKRWWENPATKGFFDAEFGPGISFDKTTADPDNGVESETNTDMIIRASATFEDTYWEKIKFTQKVSGDIATQSGNNTKVTSDSQFTTQLIGDLAARFNIRVDYNSEVDEGSKHVTTDTSLNLVYNF